MDSNNIDVLFFKWFSNSFETWPISVAILIFLLLLKILNPHGSAASWGIGKGKIFKSPITKSFNILKYFLFCSEILLYMLGKAAQVFLVAYIGILNLLDKVAILFVWSVCSWVTSIAWIFSMDIFNSPKCQNYFFGTDTCIN